MYGSGKSPSNWTTYENVPPYVGLTIILIIALIILRVRWLAHKSIAEEKELKKQRRRKLKKTEGNAD